MILDDLLVLTGKDESIYPILNILKARSITLVKNYLNSSVYDATYIEANFPDAITELVYNAYINKGNENIQAQSQGSRSVTYKTGVITITESIKRLLPLPFARMFASGGVTNVLWLQCRDL